MRRWVCNASQTAADRDRSSRTLMKSIASPLHMYTTVHFIRDTKSSLSRRHITRTTDWNRRVTYEQNVHG